MTRLLWSEDAEADLEAITDFIARDDVAAAIRMREAIERGVLRLKAHPLSGREGRLRETRELVVARTPFVVVYRLGEAVELLRVLHGARRWPPADDPD